MAAMNGSTCQDPNNLCIKGSTCNNGLCTGGQLDDCFFFPVPDDCHVAECNPTTGMCESQIGNEGLGCSSWITATTFTNQNNDIALNFNPPLVTTKLRLFNLTAGNCGQTSNSLIYEWYVYPGSNCSPPP